MIKTIEQVMCEDATGCESAGDYRQFAEALGYPFCKVLDWTSSAGDWSFIVSKDGEEWFVMSQENNWPRRGFTRSIDNQSWFGSADDVLAEICEYYF